MTTTTRTIAYVIDDLELGGAQRQLSLLARHLPAPFKPVVVSLSEKVDPFAGILEQAGVEVAVLPRRGGADISRVWKLVRVLEDTDARLIHGFLDASNIYAFLTARLTGRPAMLSLRSDRLRLGGARAKILCGLLRRTERVLVNSRAGRAYLEETVGVAADQILYAPNWVDPDFLARARQRTHSAEPHTFGCVARFDDVKQLNLLIEALPIVRRQLPQARLVLQGDGPAKTALVAQAERLGVTGAVDFVAAGPDVATTLSRLRCFTLPSRNEGLPNAAIEALAMGVPVVASAAGDVTDLIEPGRTGISIEGEDANAVANAIVACLGDDALAAACKTAGPERVAAGYSIEAGLAKLIPAYESLIGRPA